MTEEGFRLSKRLLQAQAVMMDLRERVEKLEKRERERPCLADCVFCPAVRRLRSLFKKAHEQ